MASSRSGRLRTCTIRKTGVCTPCIYVQREVLHTESIIAFFCLLVKAVAISNSQVAHAVHKTKWGGARFEDMVRCTSNVDTSSPVSFVYRRCYTSPYTVQLASIDSYFLFSSCIAEEVGFFLFLVSLVVIFFRLSLHSL